MANLLWLISMPAIPRELQENIEDDPEAKEYLEHLLDDGEKESVCPPPRMEMPEWYNESLFLKGQSYLRTYRFLITSGMLMGLIAVLSVPSILRVLIFSKQSSTPATAYRRYLRTIFHTYTWYNYPPSHPKFLTSLRAVNNAHVKSGQVARKCGIGNVTQKDMALTQFGFIGFFTLGAHRVQLFDNEFLEATVHMWRVLGHLLGIKEEYNMCGRNWMETKPRLQIVMQKVFTPALSKPNKEFEQMTEALLDGLWTVNTSLSFGSYLYFTKRLAYVPGYEYYQFDYRVGALRESSQKIYYYDLGLLDRWTVTCGLFIVTYLHQFSIVRWYLNFRVWLGEMFMYYLPYIAFWRFGPKWAYVRIFKDDNTANDFEFHLKED